MKGLVFDTENRMQFKDFGEPLLDSLQKEVGGYIEVVHPKYLPEGLCMVVDDEGRLKGSAINNIASVLYGTPEHGQPIVGNAVILREGFVAGERDFVSLTEDDETGLILMLHKCWTGAYCRYFREAVLPLNPELQASLTTEGISPELRACAVCGKAFLPEGRQAYCSDACKAEGNRRKSRERMRKMREKRPGGCYDLPPPKA